MKKHIWRWVLLLTIFVLCAALPAAAQSKSVVWNRFDVDITVNPDGTFDVVEKQEIQFIGGPFTYGFRDISTDKTEGISDIRVGDVNGDYLQSSEEEPGTFYVDQRSGSVYVKWFFEPTTDAVRTFVIRYKVHGGLRYYDEGDQLWWKAVYADRPAEVRSSVVTVKVPAPAVIENMDTYFTMADMALLDAQTAKFTAKAPIPPGKPFEVRVQFTHGVVTGAAPSWQTQADQEAEVSRWRTVANVFVLFFGLMLIFLAPVGLYVLWHAFGRDPRPAIAPSYLPEPPSDLPPGMAGTLIDEKADTKEIIATIVDLARRGYLRMEEVMNDEDSGYSTRDFLYTRLKAPDDDLREYERYVLEKLFNGERDRKLSDLKNTFYKYNAEAQQLLSKAVAEEGFFVADPNKVRRKWLGFGAVLFLLTIILSCVGPAILSPLTDLGVLLGFGPFIFAIGLMILSFFMPKKTQQGADEAAKWEAFRTYLKNLDDYVELDKATELFERYLPYAIAFGLEKRYLRMWEPVQNVPAPTWYGPQPWHGPHHAPGRAPGRVPGHASPSAQGKGGGMPTLADASSGMSRSFASMSAGLASMLTVASSTLTSRPQSSSGSSGGWSGGGWSGGGSFGGGGGGGGGGGFG
ncbi:MAG TPA: DUF2207 domain-containing protein [Caldilineae bacterium]|nr:DUF2207 domain-containing protein [Caldilineae bacterium]HIQ11970.1 DUF2207 domain-containing protein [Caldilineales bacterium]